MTTQEIKDLVAAKIAGQGSMVDAGGALPTILNAIVDAIDAIKPGEILSFEEPLKKSGTDVSLQIGGGLEKDSDDALGVKLDANGGIKATESGLQVDINPLYLAIPNNIINNSYSEDDLLLMLGITSSKFNDLMSGKYLGVKLASGGTLSMLWLNAPTMIILGEVVADWGGEQLRIEYNTGTEEWEVNYNAV